MKPIETFEHAGLTVEIHYDEDATSPRENDNVARLVCWHRNYNLGDEQPKEDAAEYRRVLAAEHDATLLDEDLDDANLDERIQAALDEHFEILPLYLYDHSGITMSTGRFSCPWDSGQVGFAYITLAKLVECDMLGPGVKEWTPELRARAREIINQEVKEYDAYIRGECYGFTITRPPEKDECGECHRAYKPVAVDSCWGFIGYEWVVQAAKEAAECAPPAKNPSVAT